jgi:hypothetical protein
MLMRACDSLWPPEGGSNSFLLGEARLLLLLRNPVVVVHRCH